MVPIASKPRTWLVYMAVVLSALGCGGRTTESTGVPDDPGPGNMPPANTPPPTCNDICRHVVDICFPGGVIDQCARDCEKTRSDYKGCALLDTFLRCNLTAPVMCGDQKATIVGCSSERIDLSRGCKS